MREHCSDKKFQTPKTSSARPGCFLLFSGSPPFVAAMPSTDLRYRYDGPFRAAESVVAPVSPSPRKDGFWTGDSNRNTNEGFVAASVHGTRSHDRGIRGESTNHPPNIGSLPRRARSRQSFANAHVSLLFSEVIAKDSITVAQ